MSTRAAPFAVSIDHLVLTVKDIEASLQFYERALKLEREIFTAPDGQVRYALRFGHIGKAESQIGQCDPAPLWYDDEKNAADELAQPAQ